MHKSTAWPLSWVYVGLVVYASLYPFGPWRDAGLPPWAYWWAPPARYWTGFDVGVNVVGYVPLGALWALALIRSGRPTHARFWPVLCGLSISAAMEGLQTFLPGRVPSREDCLLNATGVGMGAWTVLLGYRIGLVSRWGKMRERWLVAESRGGLVLLLLWPVALLFPAPVPFGLGQVWARVQVTVGEALVGSFIEDWWDVTSPAHDPLGPRAQAVCVCLGLLMVLLLAFSVLRERRQRLWGVLALVCVGALATGLSSAMSWGPQHAWSWLDLPTRVGIGVAVVLGLGLAFVPWRVSAALCLLSLGVLVMLLNDAPHSPYFALTLQDWEQGRFIRFHGVAQWMGWWWPYVCAGYLLVRLGRRSA